VRSRKTPLPVQSANTSWKEPVVWIIDQTSSYGVVPNVFNFSSNALVTVRYFRFISSAKNGTVPAANTGSEKSYFLSLGMGVFGGAGEYC